MFTKLKEIISDQLDIDMDEITENSSFKDDFGADSLDFVELIMAIEDEFEIEIPEGHGEQHVGILKNFTNHLLYGEELLAPGYEGINGLSIANAMVLSTWKNDWVELPNDGEEFWAMLQEKIKTSRNKEDAGIVFDTEGTYGNK